MSKVKIQGNASGTGVVTLTAPNTNTDRTITLPDGDISLGVGIDDNATSTAITIDASENVGIKDSTPQAEFSVTTDGNNGSGHTTGIQVRQNGYSGYKSGMSAGDTAATTYHCGFIGFIGAGHTGSGERHITFETREGTTDIASTERLRITSDGRGLSQFTAKAWVNINGTGTVAIRDSHNVSSVTDSGTGNYLVNFSNDMGNANYSVSLAVGDVTFAMNHQSYWLNNITTASFRMKNLDDVPANYYDPVVFTAIVFGD
jgi:hypothetical protein